MRTAQAIDLAPEVSKLVGHIAARFSPRQIILFGSHAAGRADTDSDVDLLVVTETAGKPIRRAAEIYRSLDHSIPVDILVRSPEQMANPNPRDLILREILAEGVSVYETAN